MHTMKMSCCTFTHDNFEGNVIITDSCKPKATITVPIHELECFVALKKQRDMISKIEQADDKEILEGYTGL